MANDDAGIDETQSGSMDGEKPGYPWLVASVASLWLLLWFMGICNWLSMIGSFNPADAPGWGPLHPPLGTPPAPPSPWLFSYLPTALLIITPISLILTLRGHLWAYVASLILVVPASIMVAPFKVRNGVYLNEPHYMINVVGVILFVLLLAGCRPYLRYSAARRH
jgi:hypothetical protein